MESLFDFSAMPRLESERLVLRAARPEADLPALYDLFADPTVAQYTDTGPFTSMAEAVEVMNWIGQRFVSKKGMRWAIALKADEDALIGTAGYNTWHRWNNSATIGYDLMQCCWGQGLMTEALGAILRFGFAQMGLNRIQAHVMVDNAASARVLTKLGFEQEGVLRHLGYQRGGYVDLCIFSLLRQDWPA